MPNKRDYFRIFLICIALPLAAVVLLSRVLAQSTVQVGYTVVSADAGTPIPVGAALFSYTNSNGVLVSEAGVGASAPIRSGRLFVDEAGTQTAIAMANTSAQKANVTFILRDRSGAETGRRTLSIAAGQHIPQYVSQLFSDHPSNFTGSLSFESDQPLAAVTLRESRNAYGEPLYTTLPVVDQSLPASTAPLVFPDIACGGGYTTQIILINSSDKVLRGNIRLVASDGGSFSARLSDADVSNVTYEISAQGAYRVELTSDAAVHSGYAVVTPDAGSAAPAGSAVFRFLSNGQLVTEAGVPAGLATTAMRIPVDYIGSQTGIALANASDVSADLTFTLMDRYGVVAGTTTRSLAPRNHVAIFAQDLFPQVGDGYSGLMEIRGSNPVVPITVKLTTNSRSDLVVTTLPVADLMHLSATSSFVFPQIAIGGGFSTHLIFINTDAANAAGGTIRFYQSDGSPMVVPVGGSSASQFKYGIIQSGARHLYPGNTAGVASVALINPTSNLLATEFVINEGNTVRPRVQVIDNTGTQRDDFDASFTSTNTDVASVDVIGNIRGNKAGFSTVTIAAGTIVATATATVVAVDAGVTGFQATGVAQDLAQRLYLASTQDHSILLAQDLKQTPQLYAGIRKTPGLKNDVRLQALFNNPAFVALNNADGSLYVSDGSNNVIRRVSGGASGRVETLAGSGAAGSQDGPSPQASFNNPQGIALDNRGSLWVVDSGNHTIRRINLVTGSVETVAGKPGVAGFADGVADAARFNSPTGISVESETTAEQLARERTGGAPPPARLIVADTGNGLVRRVRDDGTVESLRSSPSPNLRTRNDRSSLTFSAPTSVAVDPAGNIYVAEKSSNQVKTILKTGSVVAAAESGTFQSPSGLGISASGRLIVADGRSVQEIRYGEPRITTVTPDHVPSAGGIQVTIQGSNFAPESVVVVAGAVVSAKLQDTQTIVFTAPALPSGRAILTIQSRGGLLQAPILVDAVSLNTLAPGYITTVAGGSTYSGEGLVATSAPLQSPQDVATDSAGNLYIADSTDHKIRKVDRVTGIMTTVAGNGNAGRSGDGGPAVAAELTLPSGIALGSDNILLIADTGRVRKVDLKTGLIDAALVVQPNSSQGGNTSLISSGSTTERIALDGRGSMFIADFVNARVLRVDRGSSSVSTVAGTGVAGVGLTGDGGLATRTALRGPRGVAVDANGNIYVADQTDHRVRKVDAQTGIITTVAGNGLCSASADGVKATTVPVCSPPAVAIDSDGNLLVVDLFRAGVRKVDAVTGIISPVTGIGTKVYSGDGGPAVSAGMIGPQGVFADSAGHVWIADGSDGRVRKISPRNGIINTVAGTAAATSVGDNGPASAASLSYPYNVAFDSTNNIYVTDSSNRRIRKIDATGGLIRTLGGELFLGPNGVPSLPRGLALDSAGNVFFTDQVWIRKFDAATQTISTVAGNGIGFSQQGSYSGDGGPALTAGLGYPTGLAFDASGNLYIADTNNNRIRRIDGRTQRITTVAGNGSAGFSGDNGSATSANLNSPRAVILDAAGNLYIADNNNERIRKVSTSGVITTIAGNGVHGVSGDNGPATSANLNSPVGLTLDSAGNLFILTNPMTLREAALVRKVNLATGIISFILGTIPSDPSAIGDNGPASAASLRVPAGIAIDRQGNIYIADAGRDRVRAIRGPIP